MLALFHGRESRKMLISILKTSTYVCKITDINFFCPKSRKFYYICYNEPEKEVLE